MVVRKPFRVIPAVDLKDGKCVQLRGGDPSRKLVELEDPVEVAFEWQRLGASMLHVIDLDGALGGMPRNISTVKRIVGTVDIPVQFGGGIRSFKAAERILSRGVWRIILGTLAFEEPPVVKDLLDAFGPERVMVALDCRGGMVLDRGWTSPTGRDVVSAADMFQRMGLRWVLYTDIDVEGRQSGVNIEGIRRLVRAVDMGIVVSGGISSISDILSIRDLGADGVVVGTAIYTGRLNLKEAIERCEIGVEGKKG